MVQELPVKSWDFFFRNGCIYSNLSKSAIGLASAFSLSQFNTMNYHPKTQDTAV